MKTIIVKKIVNAPIEQVWASWDDFGNIFKFNPSLPVLRLLTDINVPTGICRRRNY